LILSGRAIHRRLCGTPGKAPTAHPIWAGPRFFTALSIPSAIFSVTKAT